MEASKKAQEKWGEESQCKEDAGPAGGGSGGSEEGQRE